MRKSNTDISFYHAFVSMVVDLVLAFRLGWITFQSSEPSGTDNLGD